MTVGSGGLGLGTGTLTTAGTTAAAGGGLTATQGALATTVLSGVGGMAKSALAADAQAEQAKAAMEQRERELRATPVKTSPTAGTITKVAAAPVKPGDAAKGQAVNAGSLPPPLPMDYRNLDTGVATPPVVQQGQPVQPYNQQQGAPA